MCPWQKARAPKLGKGRAGLRISLRQMHCGLELVSEHFELPYLEVDKREQALRVVGTACNIFARCSGLPQEDSFDAG